jgi:uncharacterized protein
VNLRRIEPSDIDTLVGWNNAEIPNVSLTERDRLAWIVEMSRHALIAEIDGVPGGFVITLDPGTPYDSRNYEWFTTRYDDFVYLDRVIVAPHARRRGLASVMYDAIEADAVGSRVLLEVTSDPPNEPSLAFHAARGYQSVGQLGYATMFELSVPRPG